MTDSPSLVLSGGINRLVEGHTCRDAMIALQTMLVLIIRQEAAGDRMVELELLACAQDEMEMAIIDRADADT